MKKSVIGIIALLVVVTLTTLFIRIPLPSRGYFNFGDVSVVFAGLVLGGIGPRKGVFWGAFCGGIGSAVADIIGGFALFAPITLLAKGIEGGFCAFASLKSRIIQMIFLLIGGLLMVSIYFVCEYYMPMVGPQGATAELIPNLVQAGAGIVGGRLSYAAYKRIFGDN